MKSLFQTCLIGGGVIGLVPSLLIAGYGWMMHIGFGGSLTKHDRLILYSPLFFVTVITVGLAWKLIDQISK